jgi:hypothetical protein
MPDLQPSMQPASSVPVALDAPSASDDFDYALGFECADPALQIERWMQEAGAERN